MVLNPVPITWSWSLFQRRNVAPQANVSGLGWMAKAPASENSLMVSSRWNYHLGYYLENGRGICQMKCS